MLISLSAPGTLRLLLCVVPASALLAGCASAPAVRQPVTVVPAAYDAAGTLPAVALDRWWLVYGDSQLSQLVDHALSNGFDVRQAFARLDEARATRSGALSRFGLQGSAQAQGQIQRTDLLGLSIPGLPDSDLVGNLLAPSTTKTANTSLPVSWELDLFGRRAATRRAAEADLAAARFTYEGARATLAADVARQLFQARGLAAQLDDAKATLLIQRRLADILRKKADRGLGAASETDRLAGEVAQAEAQVADLTAALDAARRALLVLIGTRRAPLDTLPVSSQLVAVPAIPAAMPGDLLTRRPDVREARARLDAAAGNVRLAEMAFFPTITLQAAIAYATQSGGLATTTVSGTGTGSLTLPIFDRAKLHAQLRGASARAEQAVLTYEHAIQTAYSETDQALIRLDADKRRIATLEAGVTRSQHAYDAALKRLQVGLSDLQAALDAERTLRTARTALTTARVDGLERSVQAFQALGGGWSPPPDTPLASTAPISTPASGA